MSPLLLNNPAFSLQILAPQHLAEVEDYFQRNAAHLAPWEPLRDASFYQREAILPRLVQAQRDAEAGSAYCFGIFDNQQGRLVGCCNFTQVVRGPFQACYLGYSLCAQYQGQGIMTDALRQGINYLFNQLSLHRIIACYIPENLRSAKVLQRLGFEEEGYARAYLKIAGRWQDHVLTALINPNYAD